MKKTLCFILCLTALFALAACSKSEYRDDAMCHDIGNAAKDTLDDGLEYAEHDDRHRRLYFEDTEHYDDCCLFYSTDTDDISEIGIFHAPSDAHADEIYEDCLDYIEDMRENSRTFIASYAPKELSKLDSADVRRFGNYVVYTVLDGDTAEELFAAIEERIKK